LSNPKPVIAVDGPAASGKGTLARKLAAHFDYAYLDTGALYRAVAVRVVQAGGDPADDEAALHAAQSLDMRQLEEPDFARALRTAQAGRAASVVAAKPPVRAAILRAQQQFADMPPFGKNGVVLDGRDIGTVVCPDAPAKLFITARAEVRAKRRYGELRADEPTLAFSDVLADITARDARDAGRAAAPMKQAADAHLLDTSDLSIEEAFSAALALVNQSIA
jgi:cytidylate kinase